MTKVWLISRIKAKKEVFPPSVYRGTFYIVQILGTQAVAPEKAIAEDPPVQGSSDEIDDQKISNLLDFNGDGIIDQYDWTYFINEYIS